MLFSEKSISELQEVISKRMSVQRYIHTLGVKQAALKIAEYCYIGDTSELIVAALLHDISKEYSEAEYFELMKKGNIAITDSDLMSPAVFHSLTAPTVIMSDFSQFATKNILSAVFNHTTGAPDMSVFDEIIFVADYIEEGRKYENSAIVRERLYRDFSESNDREECIIHLHEATISALEKTILNLIETKKALNERTIATRNAFLARVPMSLTQK